MKGITPILTCKEAAAFEEYLLGFGEEKIWSAMTKIGVGIGRAIMRDFQELGAFPKEPKILILAGKGHNTGDAFLAAAEILKSHPDGKISILFTLGKGDFRPLTKRALNYLPNFETVTIEQIRRSNFDICIGGVFGMSFTPPVREPVLSAIQLINKHDSIRFRAAVDIPSGLVFRADFTYATGIVKLPLFHVKSRGLVGRIRFIDIGFFRDGYSGSHDSGQFYIDSTVLKPLRELREVTTDKRTYGHLYILSGSKNFPGALIMSVKAALKSGLGLVTALAPESLVPNFATEIPECMWIPLPETSVGTLALKSKKIVLEALYRANAILTGPGLGDNSETLKLVTEVAEEIPLPLVIDASALVPEVFEAIKSRPENFGAVVATPHFGEFARISKGKGLQDWAKEYKVTALLKGSITKIVYNEKIFNSTSGGPILARGGSGDILSGLVGGLLAQSPDDPLGALAKAAVWHGMAADSLAREKGQVATVTTDLLEHLQKVLREEN